MGYWGFFPLLNDIQCRMISWSIINEWEDKRKEVARRTLVWYSGNFLSELRINAEYLQSGDLLCGRYSKVEPTEHDMWVLTARLLNSVVTVNMVNFKYVYVGFI
jgi:hypothetical protein